MFLSILITNPNTYKNNSLIVLCPFLFFSTSDPSSQIPKGIRQAFDYPVYIFKFVRSVLVVLIYKFVGSKEYLVATFLFP